jgi:hypothetical protein
MSDPVYNIITPRYQRQMADEGRARQKRLEELRLQYEAMAEGASAGDEGLYPEVDRAQDELLEEQMIQKGLIPNPNVGPTNPQNVPPPKAPPARYSPRQQDLIERIRSRGKRPPVV